MKRSFLLHPSTVLAAIVLVGAVGGSVYAASTSGPATVGSAEIKNGSITLKDLSPAARRALRGARGPAGPAGAAGAAGATGAAGAPGAAGSARAFGFVSSAGVLDAAKSKNLTVTKLQATDGAGVYCVTPTAASGIDRSKVEPLLSADFSDGAGSYHLVQFLSTTNASCPAGWRVVTDNFAAGAFTRTDIAFSILIP